MKEVILLAACSAGEVLPQSPDLPADVFTACLTTPIKVRAAPCSNLPRTEHAISLGAVMPADPTCVMSADPACQLGVPRCGAIELTWPCCTQAFSELDDVCGHSLVSIRRWP